MADILDYLREPPGRPPTTNYEWDHGTTGPADLITLLLGTFRIYSTLFDSIIYWILFDFVLFYSIRAKRGENYSILIDCI